MLQPADVGFFKGLKHHFRKICYDLQHADPDNAVKRKDVAPQIKEAFQVVKPQSIVNSFKKCGLYPLNVEAIDFSQCVEIQQYDPNVGDEVNDETEVELISNSKFRAALREL